MELYQKPTFFSNDLTRGIFPLVAVAKSAIAAAIGCHVVGVSAAVSGSAVGAATAKLAGKISIDAPIPALTVRKDFALE